MTVKYYEGNLGKEKFLCESHSPALAFAIPRKKELVSIKPKDAGFPEVYQVINVLYDYVAEWGQDEQLKDEIDIFVKLYDWED